MSEHKDANMCNLDRLALGMSMAVHVDQDKDTWRANAVLNSAAGLPTKAGLGIWNHVEPEGLVRALDVGRTVRSGILSFRHGEKIRQTEGATATWQVRAHMP